MTSIKRFPRKAGRNTGGYVTPGFVTKTGDRTSSTLGAGSKVDPDQRTGASQAFKDLLKNNATDDFSALLSSLGVNYNDELSEAEIADWNHQLASTQLAYEVEKEKRGYNEQMRDEQRIYDSPTNMLARLMGAGISRDAAIQMLSGAGGSSPIQSGDYTAAPGIAPSESNRNAIESKLGIANTVFGGLSAIGSMVSLGFSIPQAIQQTQFLRTQNYMNNLQRNAYDSANEAYNVLTAINAGAEAFGSISSATKAINDAAAKGDPIAIDYLQSGKLFGLQKNGTLTAPLMAKMYKDNRDAKDYNQRFYNEQRKLVLESDVLDQQVLNLAQELTNSLAEFDKINADTKFIEKQTERENATINYLNKQGRVAEAEAYSKELENRKTESLYDSVIVGSDGQEHSGLWYLTQDTLYDAVMGEMIGKAQTDSSMREYVCDTIACNQRAAYFASAIQELKSNLGLEFILGNSNLASFYNGLREIGYYDYIESLSKGTYTLSTSDEIVTPLGNFGITGSTTYRPTAPEVKNYGVTESYKRKLRK